MEAQQDLFRTAPPLPQGLAYRAGFITEDEEQALLAIVRALPFSEARYKIYTAKRRIVSYGAGYDFTRNDLVPAPPLPDSLLPIRERLAAWADMPAERFSQALVSEYRPGTPLGWHWDAPNFGSVSGLSLAASCRLRLRPYPSKTHQRGAGFELLLEPRSAYLLRDVARWRWQHSIPPTKALRYSITFRTLERRPNRRAAAPAQ